MGSTLELEVDSVVEAVRRHAARAPERTAVIFLVDGEAAEQTLTYGELDRAARRIAAGLQARVAAGERAILIYPSGLEYVTALLGCFYAGLVAVPVYPPDPARLARTLPRLRAIVDHARPSLILTTGPIRDLAQALSSLAPELGRVDWLATEALDAGLEERWAMPALRGEDLAFLQYTSGSTGSPRGVMVSHKNILANVAMFVETLGNKPGDTTVSWLPLYHDMGLVGMLLEPLVLGSRLVLMSPTHFLAAPRRWLQAITRYRGTTLAAPNFAFDLCVRKCSAADRAAYDLSSLTLAVSGAEPVRADTLERFAQAFGPCGLRREALRPSYGLAEVTLMATGTREHEAYRTALLDAAWLERGEARLARPDAPSRTLVGCGRVAGAGVVVVDPERRQPCAPGRVGEIWVAGPHVAQGYFGRPEQTEQTFGARLAGSDAGPFLRTGDLGFVHEGELFVTGRIKDLIIVRGRNLAPQDVERVVETWGAGTLRPGCSAAFAVEAEGEERVALAAEVEKPMRERLRVEGAAAAAPIVAGIRAAVAAELEVQVHAIALLAPGSIPKTTSGKIQRQATRAAFLEGTLEELVRDVALPDAAPAPNDPPLGELLATLPAPQRLPRLEAMVRARLGEVCRRDPASLDPHVNLAELGLDSLQTVDLLHRLERELGFSLPAGALWEHPTLAGLVPLLWFCWLEQNSQAGAADAAVELL